ncbi:MAG: pectate lyase, partial [Verrucomicrobiota bacterium]|nr:pectate lyase [Verrucomicrobiota bacterium]
MTGGSISLALACAVLFGPSGHGSLHGEKKDRLRQSAETILLYQRSSGGWPKNYDREESLTKERAKEIRTGRNENDATIDNGATHTEIRLWAKAVRKLEENKFQKPALRGIRYLLEAQYENGGWPQRYPDPKGYHRHVTFNDGAMIGTLEVLDSIAKNETVFSFVPDSTREKCRGAVKEGIEFILRSQVRLNGRLTVWCAQHDRETLLPAGARSYELPSLSGSESVGIVRFLMKIENPDKRTQSSIEGAVAWFQEAKLTGLRQVLVDAPGTPKGTDKKIISDPKAPPLWGRFYDLRNEKPFY